MSDTHSNRAESVRAGRPTTAVSRTGRTFRRQALALILLFLLTGLCFAGVGWFIAHAHVDVSAQQLNRDLAERIVEDNDLIYAGGDMINAEAVKSTFDHYMSFNPAIEIYQLDEAGNIVAFSADPGSVKRTRVNLAPVQALIDNNAALPVLGDDPKRLDRTKIFSATRLSSNTPALGYLYVILRGQDADGIARAFGDSYLIRGLGMALVISIGFGLIGSLLVFRFLGRRLESLASRISLVGHSLDIPLPRQLDSIDELATLENNFDAMSFRIREQMDNLQRVDNQRREFVAQVSHDLRTPLTVINTLIESLAARYDRLDDSKKLEYIQTVQLQGNSLSRLVEDLFALARLEYTDDKKIREPIAIGDLIQDVAHKHALHCEQEDLEFAVECPPDLPWVQGDIGLLERLLDNLIANAIAHTPAGGRISIEAEAVDQDVAIMVCDTGCGISGDDQHRIFEDGFKGERSSGAGFGLSIARRVAQWHGGTLALADSVSGTRFRVTLPLG